MLFRSILIGLFLALIPAVGSATTWNVYEDGSGDAPTIQAAADSSTQGDTVLVAPGTYFENIYVLEKGIILVSQSGPELTVIDGSASPGYAVHFDTVEHGVIDGFTITNGSGDLDMGIVIKGHNLLIKNNILRDNHTSVSVGGGVSWVGSGTIEDNIFIDNEAEQGGGLTMGYFEHDDTPLVRGNVFINNRASIAGGAIYLRIDEAILEENLFVSNEAPEGSGVYCFSGFSIRQNTFYGNRGAGGTISFRAVASPYVENNVIAGTLEGFAVNCIPVGGYTPEPQIRCNAFWNNEGGAWSGYGCNPAWWPGNFEADPLLCDPESGDFHLAENSPCAPGNHPYNYPCGLIGAFDMGCIPVPVAHPTTWGSIKAMYGSGK
ncbi:MAG: right-handed parallel beta-helix repeat-containing protein [Candidatus Eisenbacteria bacterium]|uniref:Right-handed parallel beta-helix repeat-containing protein n=1 Tax=Eiseniibacteriota bacterium TaxID=2212470 RepID=A0A948S1X3_UNCEI|nr:right-handed parallel beta-helix repeat-containing protein [Candidatus Eisenbacteria bacterium]MBU2693432.1 right-handed parallel beta-helix repeat-containing protein [Candidatus Eisenbacteria bacterium]